MSGSPDIAGYAEAQARLRAKMGRPVAFFTPEPTTWPEDVVFGEDGRPLDPTVQPLASGFASASVNCNVAAKTGRTFDPPADDGPLGLIGHRSLLLILDEEDFPEIADATECEVFSSRYTIGADQPDQVGGEDAQRHLVFVEKM